VLRRRRRVPGWLAACPSARSLRRQQLPRHYGILLSSPSPWHLFVPWRCRLEEPQKGAVGSDNAGSPGVYAGSVCTVYCSHRNVPAKGVTKSSCRARARKAAQPSKPETPFSLPPTLFAMHPASMAITYAQPRFDGTFGRLDVCG
jgi:hypothetical protein